MFTLITTRQFEKDLKRCIKRGLPIEELRVVLSLLVADGKLPAKYESVSD